jgi:RNA polymerase sigma-70 factor (ECF subfamily)
MEAREVPALVVAAASSEGIDQDLIVRFVSGDSAAFGEIFDRLHRDLHGLVRRFFRGAFDQEEAMQEVWLKLYRMRGRFDVSRSEEFVPWIRRVARNRCLDLLKARGRAHEVPVAELDAGARCPADQLAQVVDARVREALAALLARCDDESRRHFELCFVQELQHEQIAAELGITVRRSKYLKKRWLAQLMRSEALRDLGRETPQRGV